MKIKIEQKHIDQANRDRGSLLSTHCPMARAIRDMGYKHVSVGGDLTGIDIDDESYEHTDSSYRFISTGWSSLKPDAEPCEVTICMKL